MTIFDLIDDDGQFTAQSLMESHAEEFRDPVGHQAPKSDLAAALENPMDREVALEDEVAAVLYLSRETPIRRVPAAVLSNEQSKQRNLEVNLPAMGSKLPNLAKNRAP